MRLIEFTGQLVEQEDLRYRDDNQLLTFSTPIGNITILVNLDQYTNNFLTAGSTLKIGSQWHVSVRQILVPELGVMLLELWRATQVNSVPTADKADGKVESAPTPEPSTTANDNNTNNFEQAKAALRQSTPVQSREPVSQSHDGEVDDENIDPLAVDLSDYKPSLTNEVNDDPADHEEDTLGDFTERSFSNSAFDFSTPTQANQTQAQTPAKDELDLGNKSQMLAADDDQVVEDDEFEDTDDDLL